MKYWNAKSKECFDSLCRKSLVEGVITGFDNHSIKRFIDTALAERCPYKISAILKFCDKYQAEPARIRFSTAVKSMSMKMYDVAYACWDDEGETFLDVDDEQEFPTGVQASCILRDLCGSMFDLQRNIVERQSDIINNELCELMSRVI